jgi:uncharacterized protein (DUF58 family)
MGQARSALKGSGFEFDQIREYRMGDDVRFIDWNASARSDKMLVKQYRQERGRTVLIALDISASSRMGSDDYDKWITQADLASVLALAASQSDDAVGLILFSDHVEQYIPPMRSRHAGRFLMETLFSYRAQGRQTALAPLFNHVGSLRKKDAMLFLISDFIDAPGQEQFGVVGRLYDTVAIRCLMPQERSLPADGFFMMRDAEAGTDCLIDARSAQRARINTFLHERIAQQDQAFSRAGIDLFDVTSGSNYVPDMISFFYKRLLYI